MRIAIVASFDGFSSSYSLCNIVLDQIDGLRSLGHEVEVWVMSNCKPRVPARHADAIKPVIPVHRTDTGEVDEDMVGPVADTLELHLRRFDPDTVITHDVVFQVAYKTVCRGLAMARPRWSTKPIVHYMHSCTGDEGDRWGRECVFAGDRIIYGDRTNVDVVARGFGVPESNVHVLHTPRDVTLAQYHVDEVHALIRKYRLNERDIVQVFPASQPRLKAKGLPDAIAVFECLKAKGKDVALIVCDAHGTRHDVDEFRSEALGDDLIFTSEQGLERWVIEGLRPRELSNLRSVANLFIWPSRAEMSPLAVREAMLGGELLVLNSSVPANRELAQNDAVYVTWPEYRTIGGSVNGNEIADRIIASLDGDRRNRAQRRALRQWSAPAHARELVRVIEEAT